MEINGQNFAFRNVLIVADSGVTLSQELFEHVFGSFFHLGHTAHLVQELLHLEDVALTESQHTNLY